MSAQSQFNYHIPVTSNSTITWPKSIEEEKSEQKEIIVDTNYVDETEHYQMTHTPIDWRTGIIGLTGLCVRILQR